MFNMGTTSDYVKSVYEFVMLVIIVTKEKRLILSPCRKTAFIIVLESHCKLVGLVEYYRIKADKSGESILIVFFFDKIDLIRISAKLPV
jgi:hypothetical protein